MLAIRFATCIKKSVLEYFARLHHFPKNAYIESKMIANVLQLYLVAEFENENLNYSQN